MEAAVPTIRLPMPAPRSERRRARRHPVPGLQITLEKPGVSGLWVSDALDLSEGGLALALSADFPRGTEVLLSFELDETATFLRLPALVVWQEADAGAVVFQDWPEAARRSLETHLLWR